MLRPCLPDLNFNHHREGEVGLVWQVELAGRRVPCSGGSGNSTLLARLPVPLFRCATLLLATFVLPVALCAWPCAWSWRAHVGCWWRVLAGCGCQPAEPDTNASQLVDFSKKHYRCEATSRRFQIKLVSNSNQNPAPLQYLCPTGTTATVSTAQAPTPPQGQRTTLAASYPSFAYKTAI